MPALQELDSLAHQNPRVLRRLDAFGDRLQSEAVGEVEKCADEELVLRIVRYPAHEGPVDLDDVHRQGLQLAERGVARAEVVQSDQIGRASCRERVCQYV